MNIRCNYISKALGRAVTVNVIIPSPTYPECLGYGGKAVSYSPEAKYPVIYFLHGIGNDAQSILSYTRAELYAEENNIAVVTLSTENNFCDDEKFFGFVTEELPELVSGYFPVSEKPADTYIAGLSMGGYSAMHCYLSCLDRYAGVGCFSGAFEKSPLDAGGKKLYALAEKTAGKAKNIYLSCGTEDFILDNTVNMHNVFERLNVAHEYSIVEGYAHEWRFWDLQLESFIKRLPRTDAYRGTVRKV